MSLILDDAQQLIRDAARTFLVENAPVTQLRTLRDSRDSRGFKPDVWRAFGELGFAGALIPEAFGGQALGHREVAVIMEEIGRNLTCVPFLSTAVLGATGLVCAGTRAQQERYLPKIAAGECVVALAVDEGGKHAPQSISLSATKRGAAWLLQGEKSFVVDGHASDLLIVAARSAGTPGDRSGITLFLVEPSTAGVRTERIVTVDGHNAARIVFEGVQVPLSATLGTIDAGWDTLETMLDAGRAAVAAEIVGLADHTFERTVDYLKQRRQFGRAIGEFQALQHRAAHLHSELELTRAAVANACRSQDRKAATASLDVSIAKARAGMSGTLAVQEGIQMHGGIGMTDEFDLGFYMKRMRVAQELFGDIDFHANRAAELSDY